MYKTRSRFHLYWWCSEKGQVSSGCAWWVFTREMGGCDDRDIWLLHTIDLAVNDPNELQQQQQQQQQRFQTPIGLAATPGALNDTSNMAGPIVDPNSFVNGMWTTWLAGRGKKLTVVIQAINLDLIMDLDHQQPILNIRSCQVCWGLAWIRRFWSRIRHHNQRQAHHHPQHPVVKYSHNLRNPHLLLRLQVYQPIYGRTIVLGQMHRLINNPPAT